MLLHGAEFLLCSLLFVPFTYYYCVLYFGPITTLDGLKRPVLALFLLAFVWTPSLYSIELAMRFKVCTTRRTDCLPVLVVSGFERTFPCVYSLGYNILPFCTALLQQVFGF